MRSSILTKILLLGFLLDGFAGVGNALLAAKDCL